MHWPPKLIGLLSQRNLAELLQLVNRPVYDECVNDATSETRAAGGRGARERIESAAARLFYRNGIHATGVERIAQEANVSKRTLYQHFRSKSDLVDNYLRGFEARGGSPNERRLEDTAMSPRERLLAIFEMSPREVLRGCPFHNAAVESAGSLPGADEIVRAHKREFTRRLVAVAQQAGAADPHLLGQQLAVLFEGATAMATSLNDTAPVVHARGAAATLINAALRP
jgi:AcrR family transcriptional regulator